LNSGQFLGKRVLQLDFDPRRLPVKAVDYLVQNAYREPILSLDSYGGYLIYRLYPDEKVFIDDRHDFYGEEYLREYLKFLHAEPDWEVFLDKQHVNLILLPTKSRVSDALRQSQAWRTVYSDETATIFDRRGRGTQRVSMLNPRIAFTSTGCSPRCAGRNFHAGSAARILESISADPGSRM
jgi:hypothetical protein